MTHLLLALLAGLVGGLTGAAVRHWWPPRRARITMLIPLPEMQPGHVHADPDGKEWVALQRTWQKDSDGGGVLTATYAEGGTPADPRIKYRITEDGPR